jgi:hypothetical protein
MARLRISEDTLTLLQLRENDERKRVQKKGFIYTELFHAKMHNRDRLRGLVVRVPDYRFRGFGFDSWSYQIF